MRKLVLTLLLALLLCTSAMAANTQTFEDIENHLYKLEVLWAQDNGFVQGVTSKEFRPDIVLTRAQFAQILYRAYGNQVSYQNPYKDVISTAWFYDAAMWASSIGIIKGVTETEFSPNTTLNMYQAITILYRLHEIESEQSSPWYQPALDWAGRENIALPHETNMPITRAEACSLLYQSHTNRNRQKPTSLILTAFGYDLYVDGAKTKPTKNDTMERIYRGYHIETEETNQQVCLFSDAYYQEAQKLAALAKQTRLVFQKESYAMDVEYIPAPKVIDVLCAADPFHYCYQYRYMDNKSEPDTLLISWKNSITESRLENSLTKLFEDVVNPSLRSPEDIAEHIAESLTYYTNTQEPDFYNQLPTATEEQLAVCGGYAAYMQYVGSQKGFKVVTVIGRLNGELHAWNLILEDNQWRLYDVTALDTSGNTLYISQPEAALKSHVAEKDRAYGVALAKLLLNDIRV